MEGLALVECRALVVRDIPFDPFRGCMCIYTAVIENIFPEPNDPSYLLLTGESICSVWNRRMGKRLDHIWICSWNSLKGSRI
jgi:hypothetical protein